MNPRDFCKVARRLAGGTDPADLRTAAGRAYYAVFNVGVELIDPIVPVNRGPGGHGQIIRLFRIASTPPFKRPAVNWACFTPFALTLTTKWESA